MIKSVMGNYKCLESLYPMSHLTANKQYLCFQEMDLKEKLASKIDHKNKLEELIVVANNLCQICLDLKTSNINGINKIASKCKAELNFLNKISKQADLNLKNENLESTNLIHLQALLLCVKLLPDVTHVLKSINHETFKHCLKIDIISNYGDVWVKVIGKSYNALKFEADGLNEYGTKTIINQAEELIKMSLLNIHNFKIPHILFIFVNEIPLELKIILNGMNIIFFQYKKENEDFALIIDELLRHKDSYEHYIFDLSLNSCLTKEDLEIFPEYKIINLSSLLFNQEKDTKMGEIKFYKKDLHDFTKFSLISKANFNLCDKKCICQDYLLNSLHFSNNFNSVKQNNLENNFQPTSNINLITKPKFTNTFTEIEKANLDVTTLLALVSNLSHSRCNLKFNDPSLTAQCYDEKINPVLVELFPIIIRKQIYSCKTAIIDFLNIIFVIGGQEERKRTVILIEEFITIVDDHLTERLSSLKIGKRISTRSLQIFGTGDWLEAMTFTANGGFLRAAYESGVKFVHFLHQPRALTEQKEIKI